MQLEPSIERRCTRAVAFRWKSSSGSGQASCISPVATLSPIAQRDLPLTRIGVRHPLSGRSTFAKMTFRDDHGERRDLCSRWPRGGLLLHRAPAAKQSLSRVFVALSNRIGHLRRGPVDEHVEHLSLTVASALLLTLSGLASVGFGVIRGRTTELFVRGGELWERASWTTIGAGWGGLLLTRVGLIGFAAAVGAKLAASPTSIPLMLAITLGAQMVVERQRARAAGIPISPSRRARKRSRRQT